MPEPDLRDDATPADRAAGAGTLVDGSQSVDLQTAASMLGVHYQTAYRCVRSGRLDAHLVDGRYRVTDDAIQQLQARRSAPAPVSSRPGPGPARRARAAERMLVAAHMLDLGGGVSRIRPDVREGINKALRLPANRSVRTIVALGHPTEDALAPQSAPGKARLPREEVVYDECWQEPPAKEQRLRRPLTRFSSSVRLGPVRRLELPATLPRQTPGRRFVRGSPRRGLRQVPNRHDRPSNGPWARI